MGLVPMMFVTLVTRRLKKIRMHLFWIATMAILWETLGGGGKSNTLATASVTTVARCAKKGSPAKTTKKTPALKSRGFFFYKANIHN